MKASLKVKWTGLFCFLTTILVCQTSKAQGFSDSDLRKHLVKYNPVWTEQSKNSTESMPLSGSKGNGLNVWVQDGDIYFYMANNECYDENADLLKLGCIRLHLSPNPFEVNGTFKQELDIYSSRMIITGTSKDGLKGKVSLWFDIRQPAVYAQIESSKPISMKASFATWRDKSRFNRIRKL